MVSPGRLQSDLGPTAALGQSRAGAHTCGKSSGCCAEVLCRLLSRSVIQQGGYRTCGQLLPLFMWLLPHGLVPSPVAQAHSTLCRQCQLTLRAHVHKSNEC